MTTGGMRHSVHAPTRRLSLDPIAGWEAAVLASIAGATGTLDERDAQIARSGFYGEYPAILEAYVALFADAGMGLEALKRAAFIAWYGGASAPCVSAIRALPEHAVRATVAELERRVQRGGGDDELRWMLAWYGGQGPWVLDLYGTTSAVPDFVGDWPADAWSRARIAPASLMNRGQLGQYWRALVAGRRLPGA